MVINSVFCRGAQDHLPCCLTLLSVGTDVATSGRINADRLRFTNSLGMHMVPIASGSFVMGSEQDPGTSGPQHEVTISRPFQRVSTEVTNSQYEQFVRNTSNLRPAKQGFSIEDDEAVSSCPGMMPSAFCAGLSDKEGRSLPPADRGGVGICVPGRYDNPRITRATRWPPEYQIESW